MNVIPSNLFAKGHALDLSANSFGSLRRSDDAKSDTDTLHVRFREDGYLYIPGFFDRNDILEIRLHIARVLAKKGLLDPACSLETAVKHQNADLAFLSDPRLAVEFMNAIAKGSEAAQRLLYSGRIIQFFENFFADAVRHFDFTWVRTMGRGFGTDPHCDIVYMGRGSSKLCTCWVPYGDISYEIGGLMILEGSHRQTARLKNYLARDVDTYCTNKPEAQKIESGEIPWTWDGVLSKNPVSLRELLGGRWLTSEYRMGDLMIFGMTTVHASLDNQTDYFRFSTDTRYQPASDEIDERWIGEKPIGHGTQAKRGHIC